MTQAFRLALTLLSVARVRGPRTVDRRLAGRAVVLAPLVGLLLGLVAAAVLYVGRRLTGGTGLDDLLPAVEGLAVLALLTRGLHLDGLADLADGLGSGAEPDRALELMRRGDVGPFGVVTVLFVLLLQTTALARCVETHRGTVSLLAAAVTGRLAVVLACRRGVPAARPDGLGALVAGTVAGPVAAASVVVWTALAVLSGRFDVDGGRPGEAVQAGVAVLAGLASAELLRRRASRRLGGVTGDVLGALVETATTVTLVVLSARVPPGVARALDLHGH